MKAHERERTKLKKILSARERQCQCAIKGLKAIVDFQSAAKSTFFTEVQHLQSLAVQTLVRMENVQRIRKLRAAVQRTRTKIIDRRGIPHE